jgi:hypothetical protein
MKKLCSDCKEIHLNKGINHDESSIKFIKEFNFEQYFCKEHKDNILDLFCVDCEYLLCNKCLYSNKHDNHKRILLKDSEEKIKEINKNNYNKMIESYKIKFQKFDNKEKEFENNIKNFENEILNINNKILENKKNKNEELIEYQKLLNFKYFTEEKPIQFLMKFNNDKNDINNIENIKTVYGFGNNMNGELGIEIGLYFLDPIILDYKLDIKKIIVEESSTFILSSN